MHNCFFRSLNLTFVVAALTIAGCGGGGNSAINGSVSYNGDPVEAGQVSFTPVGAGAPFGAKIVEGKYSVEKAAPGQYVATVSATRSPNAKPLTRDELAKNPNYSPNYIPEDAAGNKQTVDVVVGSQLNFALTGPPRP